MKKEFHVYHFRGDYQASFETPELAQEWIDKQKLPASEYYWERGGRD
jgi:hypothetical protein